MRYGYVTKLHYKLFFLCDVMSSDVTLFFFKLIVFFSYISLIYSKLLVLAYCTKVNASSSWIKAPPDAVSVDVFLFVSFT